jgi:putative membrane protein
LGTRYADRDLHNCPGAKPAREQREQEVIMQKTLKLTIMVALGTLSLAGCSTMLEPYGSTRRTEMTPTIAPAFVAMAASSDMFEIQSSRMALQRSQNPMIRMHADMMIRDHTNTTSQLTMAAQTAGIGVPMAMMPMHQAMLDQLSRSRDFDATFKQQQIVSHQEALALHSRYAARGDVPALRSVAALAVPVVRGHLQHAQMM